MNPQRLTIMRLQKEEQGLEKDPIPNAIVTRDGLLKFHFCLYNLDGDYKDGFYHGLFQLHQNYPFNAPKLYFFTPNGRFDTNIPICTSFTNYHQETWTSAWNVRTLILATISFMYSQQPSYGCIQNSSEIRRQQAIKSLQYNLKNEEFVKLFKQKLRVMNLLSFKASKQQKEQIKELKEEVKEEVKTDSMTEEIKEQLQNEYKLLEPNLVERQKQHYNNQLPKDFNFQITIGVIIGLVAVGTYFLLKHS